MNNEQTPALREAVENMANMREAYNNLSQAAEAYNTGKTELAANITAKGVQASASETLPELAEKVAGISQETYEINGGEMYAKQLFGSLETPNYWNLYEIMEKLLSDGRLANYGGILLAEYYKNYDSLALAGAGSGGAYVVSDKDENGNFIMYTNDAIHTWDTAEDGKGNRWVAYCFADAGHNFNITDTNICPSSIHIGRHVGTITNLINGRIGDIVVTDDNKLDCFDEGSFTNNFGRKVILRNLGELNNVRLINVQKNTEILYLKCDKILYEKDYYGLILDKPKSIKNLIVECQEIQGRIFDVESVYGKRIQTASVIIKCPVIKRSANGVLGGLQNRPLILLDIEEMKGAIGTQCDFPYIYIGYKDNNKAKSVYVEQQNGTVEHLTDIELQAGWCKPLSISFATELLEANMYAHILQRLKQDAPNCGSGVTITLGSTNLEKLTSQESQDLLAELRGTYGYTFA